MTDPNQTHERSRTATETILPGSLSRRRLLQTGAALGAGATLGTGAGPVSGQGDDGAPTGEDLEWNALGVDPEEPTGIDFDPQGRLWIANKAGELEVADPSTGESTTALTLSVFDEWEHGLVGVAVDPDFEETSWIYVCYSPPSSETDPSIETGTFLRVSRFEVDGDQIDPSTEEEVLRIPNQREQPFHVGGGLDFGPDGVLHVGLGDNTHALQNHVSYFLHDGDENNTGDSRGTAMDTSDLRGSILRIVPEEDGSYSIPEGNLFPEDEYADEIEDGTVRPEIFAMGFRNPFKVHVDDETGWVFGAGQATQATSWDADYGPPGLGPVFRFTEAGVLGWPMFRGTHPYKHPEAAELADGYEHLAGERYDVDGPINASPRNDGLRELPPIDEDATLAFAPSAGNEDEYLAGPGTDEWDVPEELPYPELTDYSPIVGTLIRTDDAAVGGLPDRYDGTLVFGLWNTGDLYAAAIDEDGDLADLEPFLSDLPNGSFTDAAVGPDGRLYLVDWGEADFEPSDPTIYQIAPDTDVEVSETFELEGETSGWIGVAPDDVADEENPSLDVEPGRAYRVEWTNADGVPHNFAIRTEDEEVVLSTERIGERGATQTVEFTATEEMDHYVCQPHPTAMRGPIAGGDDGGEREYDGNLGDPQPSVTVGMTADNAFDPHVAHVEPGGTVTWEYEGGQPHNAVAYHPDAQGDQVRIPEDAEPWEGDLLSETGDSYERTFEEPGVYNYVCTPHETAGMVGTIVVGWPDPDDEPGLEPVSGDVPDAAAEALEQDVAYVGETLADEGPSDCYDADAAGVERLESGDVVCDVDGDGNYRDVDASGDVTAQDLSEFFANQHRDPWDSRTDLFDFNGDGNVGQPDVVDLFESL